MRELTFFLGGDVMTGRGIDQILPQSNEPELKERSVKDANRYVRLAEEIRGSIPEPVNYRYIWGDSLQVFNCVEPNLKVVNLETSVTRSGQFCPRKGIHYRMHPANIKCLIIPGIDVCCLANNHTLDFGKKGLIQTLETLDQAGIRTVGAGRNQSAAESPITLSCGEVTRVHLVGAATPCSGVPQNWSADDTSGGINVITDLSRERALHLSERISRIKQPSDLVIFTVHWGGNWGYEIPDRQRNFARTLIDEGAVDLVHGHSSHHAKAIEVHKDRPILYGSGDLITDYEGIRSRDDFRDDLGLMYFPSFNSKTGELTEFTLIPTQIRKFRIKFPDHDNVEWLRNKLNQECKKFGTTLKQDGTYRLRLAW